MVVERGVLQVGRDTCVAEQFSHATEGTEPSGRRPATARVPARDFGHFRPGVSRGRAQVAGDDRFR